MVGEEGLSQTNSMGQVGRLRRLWGRGRLHRLYGRLVAQAMWWGNYSENNATLWPILQAETFQIFS